MPLLLSREQLLAALPKLKTRASWVDRHLPFLNAALEEFSITTPKRIAQALAQWGHESVDFTKLEENLNYSAKRMREVWPSRFRGAAGIKKSNALAHNPEALANYVYANRYGNGPESSGDGWRYRGRSVTHLTFRDNYRLHGRRIGVDLEADPDAANRPENMFRIAGSFWKENKLNAYADREDTTGLTFRLNGGDNGLADRKLRYARAKKALAAIPINPLTSQVPDATGTRSDSPDTTRHSLVTNAAPMEQINSGNDGGESGPISEPTPQPEQPNVNIQQAGGVTVEARQPTPDNADPKNIVKVTAGSGSWVRSVLGWLGGLAAIAQEHIASVFGLNPEMQRYLFFAALGGGVLYLLLKFLAERQVRNIAADPSKSSVK